MAYQDYDHIEKNFVFGVIVGILPVMVSSIGFAGGITVGFISLALCMGITIVLLQSDTNSDYKMKRKIAMVTYPIVQTIALITGSYSSLFSIMNPDYVREYGGANAGDGFGLLFLHIPISIIMLICSIVISGSINSKINDNSK